MKIKNESNDKIIRFWDCLIHFLFKKIYLNQFKLNLIELTLFRFVSVFFSFLFVSNWNDSCFDSWIFFIFIRFSNSINLISCLFLFFFLFQCVSLKCIKIKFKYKIIWFFFLIKIVFVVRSNNKRRELYWSHFWNIAFVYCWDNNYNQYLLVS